MESVKIIKVKLHDGKTFEAEQSLLERSGYFKNLFQTYESETEITLPEEFSSKHFGLIMEWLEAHKDESSIVIPTQPLRTYDYVESVGKLEDEFFEKIFDKNYDNLTAFLETVHTLDIKPLLEQGAAKVACLIKDFTAEEFVKTFHIEENCTEEDLKKIEQEVLEQRQKEYDERKKREELEEKQDLSKVNEEK